MNKDLTRKPAKTQADSKGLPQLPFKITKNKIDSILGSFENKKILILGDIMLDRYLIGDVSRISPEAPVPVVDINREYHLLGGAANVASNIGALNAIPILAGVIGNDSFAGLLKDELAAKGFDVAGIFTDSKRPTTVKTRIIANNQQVVRADRESIKPISSQVVKKIITFVKENITDLSAVIISDYGKGVIGEKLLSEIIGLCLENDIFISVDPKESHFWDYKKVSTITPNHHEAGFVVGQKVTDDKSLNQVGKEIIDRLESRSVLVTLGEKGMALFERDGQVKVGYTLTKIPTLARKVYDVTGAGDTVVAAMTLAAAAGADLKEAALIANIAAGEVVGEIGTAQVKFERLTQLVKSYL